MPVLVASKFEEDLIQNERHFVHHQKGTQLQNDWSDLAVICAWDFMPDLVTCMYDGDWIYSNVNRWIHHFLHYESMWGSLLPVSLMKIRFIVTEKNWRHHFLHYKSMGKTPRSRANNAKANNPIRPKFELIRTFMPAPVTSKFDKDPSWLSASLEVWTTTTEHD